MQVNVGSFINNENQSHEILENWLCGIYGSRKSGQLRHTKLESEGAKNLSFGAKTSQDSEELVSLLAERSARINSLEVEVK